MTAFKWLGREVQNCYKSRSRLTSHALFSVSIWGGGKLRNPQVREVLKKKNQLKLPKWLNCLEIVLSEVSNTLEWRRTEEQGLFKVAGTITVGIKIVQAVSWPN